MPKTLKLIIAIFVGVDIFVFGYLTMSQLRVNLFGEGQIPGAGSAMDMALFLIPLFVAYVAGDRLYHFLTYKERRATRLQATQRPTTSPAKTSVPEQTPALVSGSVWQDQGWDDPREPVKNEKNENK